VFFSDADHSAYLKWLGEHAGAHGVEILAYCLMPNHVHLIVVPRSRDSLQHTFRQLHRRYAQCLNRRKDWSGHVWQGRYFASVLDESYFWSAIRYVELNPVRAKLVRRAEDYRWSSAQSHCGLRDDPVLSASPHWRNQFNGIADWSAWLEAGLNPQHLEELRTRTRTGMPCGSSEFIQELEARAGRSLRVRPRGRPWPRNSVG
jgi:putative transposase